MNQNPDTLTVFADHKLEIENKNIIRVYWSTGKNRLGAIDVSLPLMCIDSHIIAELVAIRYLLTVRNVFNQNRTGINLKIIVSKGAIKKFRKNSSSKSELYEYGYSILTRFSEAIIEVDKDKSWIPSNADLNHIPVVDGELLRGIDTIETHQLGEVSITVHAMERYSEQCGTKDMSTTWKNLIRRLKTDKLLKIALPDRVILHKLRKYGECPEIWKHPNNDLHFVFCKNHNAHILVTVFNKDPDIEKFIPFMANK